MNKKNQPSIAILGAGYWGKNLVRNFYELDALKLVVDSNEKILQKITNDYSQVSTALNYCELLNDSSINGVVLATPADTHYELTKLMLEAGKHVFVEKPLALSYNQALELVELAKQKKLVLMSDHLLKFHSAILKLKELIQKNELGKIRYIYSRRLNYGKIRHSENVLWSLAPHDIYLIMTLLGKTTAHSVFASGGAFINEHLEDQVEADIFFDNSITAHIAVSWLNPVKEHLMVISGDKKMAVFNDLLPWENKLTLYNHSVNWDNNLPVEVKGEAQAIALVQNEPLKEQCKLFLKAIQDNDPSISNDGEALEVLAVLEAMTSSLKKRSVIELDSIKNTPQFFVHPSAIVDEGVKIGAGCKIWHFSHVLTGSEIGENCNLGQNVVLGPKVKIGAGCKIQNNVSLYEGVELEDDVFCGPSMVFTNVINPRAHINRKAEYKKTKVCKGASIGANATIVCGHQLGRYCFIAAGAVITKNVPDHALMVGAPAKRTAWVCACGQKLSSDLSCQVCGKTYYETSHGLAEK